MILFANAKRARIAEERADSSYKNMIAARKETERYMGHVVQRLDDNGRANARAPTPAPIDQEAASPSNST